MPSPPPSPFALGAFVTRAACVACAAGVALGPARARADQGPAQGAPRVAQIPGNDVPLGRSRADQPPGNDAPAGLPRPTTLPGSQPPPATSVLQPTPGAAPTAPQPPVGVPGPLDSARPGQPRPGVPGAPTATPGVPTPGAPTPDAADATSAAGASAPGAEGGTPAPARSEPARVTSPRPPAPPDVYLQPRKPREIMLEIGPSVLYESRTTRGGDGPAYKDALAFSFAARARLFSWLYVGARYRTVAHILYLPPGSFGLPGQEFDDSRRTYVRSLDGYLHPTVQPFESLRVWATIGLGWGQITMPPILTTKPAQGSTLPPRRGVFGDVPLGLGVAYTLPWRWLTLSAEGLFEPVFYQEGGMYEPSTYVDRANGALNTALATPMPKLRHSTAGVIGLSFAL
ncbi:MAG TPA: hypothetical protein VFS00_16840 [Polyangiaceae bacterium]|nr:hypothetical protein [Polyangiaceae bacterium]